jgi:hypothetical protein
MKFKQDQKMEDSKFQAGNRPLAGDVYHWVPGS